MGILLSFDLCAINTWRDKNHTLESLDGLRSLGMIDFICSRAETFVTQRSNQVDLLHEFPVGCWRGGSHHIPSSACIEVRAIQCAPMASRISGPQAKIHFQAKLNDHANLRDYQPRVERALRSKVKYDTTHVNQILSEAATQVPYRSPAVSIGQESELSHPIRDMWSH